MAVRQTSPTSSRSGASLDEVGQVRRDHGRRRPYFYQVLVLDELEDLGVQALFSPTRRL